MKIMNFMLMCVEYEKSFEASKPDNHELSCPLPAWLSDIPGKVVPAGASPRQTFSYNSRGCPQSSPTMSLYCEAPAEVIYHI